MITLAVHVCSMLVPCDWCIFVLAIGAFRSSLLFSQVEMTPGGGVLECKKGGGARRLA